MIAPDWLNAIVRDFGRAAGVDTLAPNDRGAASLTFETGVVLRFEYTGTALVVAVTVPRPADPAVLRRVLAFAHHRAGGRGVRLRAGYLAASGLALLAVRIPERGVTQPALNAAFAALWRAAGELGGAA
jgi:type III secretion system chaperone SycN